jgi:hypothetical protein
VKLRTFCTTTIAALALLTVPAAAQADPIFSLIFPAGDFKALSFDLEDHSIASADVDLSAFINDPVYSFSAPIATYQLPGLPPPGDVPLLSLFDMPEILPTSFFYDESTMTVYGEYGPGSFSIGIVTGDPVAPIFPWLNAAFDSATFSANVLTGTGVFFGDAVLSGFSFDASGLVNPGSFVFALGAQDLAGLQLQYQITPGAITGSTAVPEPGTVLLLLMGLGMAAAWRITPRFLSSAAE